MTNHGDYGHECWDGCDIWKDIVMVTGSRDFTDRAVIYQALTEFKKGAILLHGAARGADTIAAEVGKQLGMEVIPFPAKWKQPCEHSRCKYVNYCKEAGKERNLLMLDYPPTCVVAFFAGKRTPGTSHSVENATKRGIPVREYGLD